MELPVLQMSVDDSIQIGITCMSLVDRPAIKVGWIAFEEQQVKFSIENEEERIVFGAVLIPNQLIYREFEGIGKCNVTCTEANIRKIREKFFKSQNTTAVNTNHQGSPVQAYLMESFISDEKKGIPNPAPFDSLPYGTWYVGYKIEDDQVWEDVKSGKFVGFSLEGQFNLEPHENEDSIIQEIEQMLLEVKKKVELGGPGSGPQGGEGGGESSGGGKTVSISDPEVQSLVSKAAAAAPELDKIGKDAANKFGAKITDVNLKSADSIVRKTNDEEGGNLSNIKDAVRSTIIHDDNKAISNIISDFKTKYPDARIKEQNHETNSLGYQGNIINVKLKNGLIGEVQVNTSKMIYAKEKPEDAIRAIGQKRYDEIKKSSGIDGGKGHTIYEEYRKLKPQTDFKRMAQLEKESKNYYKNFIN